MSLADCWSWLCRWLGWVPSGTLISEFLVDNSLRLSSFKYMLLNLLPAFLSLKASWQASCLDSASLKVSSIFLPGLLYLFRIRRISFVWPGLLPIAESTSRARSVSASSEVYSTPLMIALHSMLLISRISRCTVCSSSFSLVCSSGVRWKQARH